MLKIQCMLEILNYIIFALLNYKVIGLYREGLKLKIMLLFLIIKNGNSSQIVYSNFFDNPLIQNNDWFRINKDSNYEVLFKPCGSANILYIDNKITQYNVLLHRSFSLNPHKEVTIEFKLWKIDNWINNSFLIYVDNEIILDQLYSCSLSATNICGDSQNDEVTMISKSILHDRPSIQIVIFAQNGKWGISEFILTIEEFDSVKSCDFNKCYDQRLILESFTSILILSFPISEGWNDSGSISNLIDYCHDLYYHKFLTNSFEKLISLDFHIAISFKLKIMIFNSDTTTITLKIDDSIVQQWSYAQKWINYDHTDRNFKGFWYHYTQTNVNIENYAHTQPQIKITIQISTSAIDISWAPWFGIREFQLYTILQHLHYICKDQNINAFDGCFSYNYDCVQGCKNCINGICIKCLIGWQYIEINKSCIPICGDLILTQQEECDDGNEYPYDGCHNCKFQCSLNCNICQFGQCLQERNSNQQQLSNVLLDFKPNFILYHNLCIKSYYDLERDGDFKNFECYLQGQSVVEELYQKVFIESIIMQHPILEQYIIYQFNQVNFNKIYQCKQNGYETCQECENGFTLNINHRECVPQCGDGIVYDYEICDDQNNLQQDGCYKCQQSCQLECLYCINGECSICLDGWQLINKTCQQICGDGLLAIQSNEQCDDGNQNDGDGCFQCVFECVPYCLYCIDQYHCLNCQKYFELIQNSCTPICGDSYIVEGLEECEDGNQIANDGCHNCQFQCEIDCIICINGKCKEYQKLEEPIKNDTESIIQQIDQICNEGCLLCLEEECQLCEQFSTLENGQCIQCGNGYKSEDEFCDDGNTQNNDGCSDNCNIEQGWDCNNKYNQFSQCYKIAQLSLNFLNQSYDTQYVSLTYTNKVKLYESNQIFFDSSSIFIQGLNSNYFNLTIQPVTEIIFESVRDINYIIEITFLEKIENQPKLIVSMNTVLLDENEIIVPTSCTDIELRIPQVMDSSQLQNTQRLQVFGSRLMMGLTGFGVLLLIFGQLAQFLEILDILQYQSYLKFINIEYPINLQIYFQSSDFVQLNNILINCRIVETLNLIIYQENLQSKGIFNRYQLNADLLTNIYGQIVQILMMFFGYIILLIYIFYSKTNCFQARYFYNIRRIKSEIVNYIAIKIYYFHRKIHKIPQINISQELIFIFHSNSFDLIFKILLYLNSIFLINLRSEISIGICLGFVIIMIKILIKPFQRGNKTILIKKIKEQQLESITLFKKFLFLLILVRVQVQPLLQCFFLSFCQLLYIEIIWFFSLAQSKFELMMIILNEFPIMMFTFVNASFCSDFSQYFTQNTKLLIGFFQMALLLIGVFGPIIKLINQIYYLVKNYLSDRKEKMQKIQIQNLNLFIDVSQMI